jgi:hypothetical protein
VTQARFDDLWKVDEPIALIKIDVEGAEMAALHGMSGCLARDEPDVILEVTDQYLRALGSSAESLVRFLADLGYSMYQIGANSLARIDRPADLTRCPPQFNALFTKKQASAWTF